MWWGYFDTQWNWCSHGGMTALTKLLNTDRMISQTLGWDPQPAQVAWPTSTWSAGTRKCGGGGRGTTVVHSDVQDVSRRRGDPGREPSTGVSWAGGISLGRRWSIGRSPRAPSYRGGGGQQKLLLPTWTQAGEHFAFATDTSKKEQRTAGIRLRHHIQCFF